MTSINPEQAMLLKTYNSIQDTYRSSKQLIATLHSSIVFNSKCVVRKVLPPNLEIHLSPYTWPKGLDKSLSDNSDNYEQIIFRQALTVTAAIRLRFSQEMEDTAFQDSTVVSSARTACVPTPTAQ
jgi:hypothetical protein